MGMNIELLVAENMRDVLLHLRGSKEAFRGLAERQKASDAPLVLSDHESEAPLTTLDVSKAETVEGGSLILAAPAGQILNYWAVLARAESVPQKNRHLFTLRGCVKNDLDPVRFVSSAYRVILERAADTNGEAAYAGRLSAGTLKQNDVLRILLSSREARNKGRTLLVVGCREGDMLDNAILDQSDMGEFMISIQPPSGTSPIDEA